MDLTMILVMVLTFVSVAAIGLVVAGAGGGSAKTAKRVQAVAQRGRGPRQQMRTAAVDSGQRRKQMQRSLQEQEKRRRKASLDIATKLRQADYNCEVKLFWMICAGLSLVVVVVAFMLHAKPLVALLAGFAGGFGLPLWWLGARAKRRRAKFVRGFADAVDVIVRGLRSGLPLQDCFKVIAREAPEPLDGEFKRLIENLAVGLDMDQALDKMNERMATPELRFFSIVLNIQQKTGGNLGEALSNLSAVLRARRMLREKVKALSGEAVASAGVIGSLPPGVAILISLSNRQYLDPLFHDHRGHTLLMIAGGMMAFGTFVMRKMIDFKF